MRSGKTARDNVILEAAMEKEVIISIKGMQKYGVDLNFIFIKLNFV